MISPWIIEEIRKKEKQVEEEEKRPVLRLPLEEIPCQKKEKELESNRGVVVIDIGGPHEEE